jgi:hypothetical protein
MYPQQQTPQHRLMNFEDAAESDNSRWELEYDDIITNLKHSFNSEEQLPTGQWYKPEGVKPKLNKTGVSDIISDLKGLMHKGIALGNIDIEYAKEQTKALAKAFADKIVSKTEAWQVDKDQRAILIHTYAQCVFMTLTRPVGDKERMHRSKKHKFSENLSHNLDQPQEITGL